MDISSKFHLAIRIALLTVLSFCSIALASPIQLAHEQVALTDFPMSYFVDQREDLSFDEVRQQPFAESSNKLSLGTKAKHTWAKVELQNTTSQPLKLFLHHPYAYHNRLVGLYEVVGGSLAQQRILDLDDSDTFQWLYDGSAVFEIELAPQQEKTLYIQSVSFSHQWFTLELYSEDQSKRALLGQYSDIAILVGMLLALILFNLLLFAYSRKRDSLYYACYLISGAVWVALSYGLVADLFNVYGSITLYWHLTLMTMPIFLILFMMEIFETRKQHRTEHFALVIVLLILVAEFFYGTVDIIGALRFSSMLAAFMMFTTLSVSISLVIKRQPIAGYFLLGHSCFVGFSGVAVLFYQGRIPFDYIPSHGVGIGIMLEAIVLALIIAYRIRLLEEIKAAQDELKVQASTDYLTQLLNRRQFRFDAERLHKEAILEQQPASLMLCDIDYFKKVNDQYGHAAGDKVIIAVAQTLQHLSRESDIVARYGGEEFILMLPNTSVSNAGMIAERIRKAIAEHIFHHDDGQTWQVTISIGVAPLQLDHPIELSLKMADDALYEAKNNGRNQVYVYTEENHNVSQLNLLHLP